MPDLPQQRNATAALIIALFTACLGAVSVDRAVRWYGHPFAGVLITPQGIVSSIGLPTWSGIEQGLRFPDHPLTIDGQSLTDPHGLFAASIWDHAVEEAARLGHETVHVRFATEAGERDLDLRVEPIDSASWWLYGGVQIFTGALYALAAIVAVSTSSSGLARTFAKSATWAAAYLFAFFDAHTTRSLVPIEYASYAYVPFALTSLALRLPDDVPIVRKHPWILGLLDAAGVTLAGIMLARNVLGISATTILTICTMLLGGALISFVIVLGVRYARAAGTRRATLGVLVRGMATPYVVVGLGVLLARLTSKGSTAAFFAIPAMALAPVATGVAFVRHDLWGSRAVLSRMLTRVVIGGISGALAIGMGAAVAAALGVPFRSALVAASLGAVIAAPLVYLATGAVERRFFPAVAQYKPTIEQLSEELTSITDPNEVGLAVERTVRRWLPCERVGFVTASEGEAAAALPAPPSRRKLDNHDGAELRAEDGGSEDHDSLSIPASFGGRTLGWLSVGLKRGGALFTTDDVDLLATIANQAGLALAHAHSYAELEQRRQQQAAQWQTERLALVETVAAEIAHEVRYPINFFRSVFRRDAANATLDAEEIDIGCEEVDRLERLVSGLRRMVGHRIDRRIMAVTDLAARAEMLLRDALAGRSLEVDIPAEAALRCDSDQITQVLVNLVANAIDATGPRGRVGVAWIVDEDGAELVVWDDGPGFETDPSHLFTAWFTTKPRGTGLGLAITQRIVRSHGWGVDAMRVEGRTRFVVTIPSSDVIGSEPPMPPVESSENIPLVGRGEEHEDSDRR
jgi:signal transduction histidine kinase